VAPRRHHRPQLRVGPLVFRWDLIANQRVRCLHLRPHFRARVGWKVAPFTIRFGQRWACGLEVRAMRVKAVRDLADWPDDEFFEEVATGLALTARNALSLEDDARELWRRKRGRAHAVLRSLATEEAAKFLILLDAVRCPRHPRDVFERQLSRFHNHLAKGVYARYCDLEPATLADADRFTKSDRLEYYLDGPNDVDWIFPNSILFARESALYVDYIETDEGHMWQEPWLHNVMLESGFPYHTPCVVRLVRSLHAVGIATAEALRIVAETWRPVAWTADFHRRDLRALNSEMLNRLGSMAADAPAEASRVIVDRWLFPLYAVDLGPIKVSQEALRVHRDDYWYRQMGA
jgi:AbiV family abortive infection protein